MNAERKLEAKKLRTFKRNLHEISVRANRVFEKINEPDAPEYYHEIAGVGAGILINDDDKIDWQVAVMLENQRPFAGQIIYFDKPIAKRDLVELREYLDDIISTVEAGVPLEDILA